MKPFFLNLGLDAIRNWARRQSDKVRSKHYDYAKLNRKLNRVYNASIVFAILYSTVWFVVMVALAAIVMSFVAYAMLLILASL